MNSIILIGNGGHCKSCIDVIEGNDDFKIKGIIKKKGQYSKEKFMGYEIIGDDTELSDSFLEKDYGFVCVGQIKTPDVRIRLFNLLRKHNINIATIKSNYSIISKHAKINIGTIIMNNTVINSDVRIGANCIINTNSIIEHDVNIKDHCHISTGAIINGGVEIGAGCFIGSGTIIKEGIKVGDNALVSAGEVILQDIPANTKYKTKNITK